jgi:hypothetical protein
MKMTVVINKLFQPLTFQTANGAGLHLSPRGRMKIADNQVSIEMHRAAERGYIVLETEVSKTAAKKEG